MSRMDFAHHVRSSQVMLYFMESTSALTLERSCSSSTVTNLPLEFEQIIMQNSDYANGCVNFVDKLWCKGASRVHKMQIKREAH